MPSTYSQMVRTKMCACEVCVCKESNTNKLNESPEKFSEWKEPILRGNILYDFTYEHFWNDKIIEIENKFGCQGLEMRGAGQR